MTPLDAVGPEADAARYEAGVRLIGAILEWRGSARRREWVLGRWRARHPLKEDKPAVAVASR